MTYISVGGRPGAPETPSIWDLLVFSKKNLEIVDSQIGLGSYVLRIPLAVCEWRWERGTLVASKRGFLMQ